jgi:transcriptional regulator with XRE-family HTH domain
MGLMTGEDIKAMRKRLGLTQKQLTALLECGEKSLSRWENGHGYPTGIVNKMLRLLDEGVLEPRDLEAVSGPRCEPSSESSSERFIRHRARNVVAVDFREARAKLSEASVSDDELLQVAQYS